MMKIDVKLFHGLGNNVTVGRCSLDTVIIYSTVPLKWPLGFYAHGMTDCHRCNEQC